jgi:hypothetical protein
VIRENKGIGLRVHSFLRAVKPLFLLGTDMGKKATFVVICASIVCLISCSGPWKSYPGTIEYPGKKLNVKHFVTRTRNKSELWITFRGRDVDFRIHTPKPIRDHSNFAYVKYRFDDGPWVKSDDWVSIGKEPSNDMVPQAGTELSLIQQTLDARRLYFAYDPKYDPPETLEFDVYDLKNAEDFSNQYTLRAKREESFDKCYYEGTTPTDNNARYDYCDGLPDQR